MGLPYSPYTVEQETLPNIYLNNIQLIQLNKRHYQTSILIIFTLYS